MHIYQIYILMHIKSEACEENIRSPANKLAQV